MEARIPREKSAQHVKDGTRVVSDEYGGHAPILRQFTLRAYRGRRFRSEIEFEIQMSGNATYQDLTQRFVSREGICKGCRELGRQFVQGSEHQENAASGGLSH
jgi:hypothetical protein